MNETPLGHDWPEYGVRHGGSKRRSKSFVSSEKTTISLKSTASTTSRTKLSRSPRRSPIHSETWWREMRRFSPRSGSLNPTDRFELTISATNGMPGWT